jgi:hypothetical protein
MDAATVDPAYKKIYDVVILQNGQPRIVIPRPGFVVPLSLPLSLPHFSSLYLLSPPVSSLISCRRYIQTILMKYVTTVSLAKLLGLYLEIGYTSREDKEKRGEIKRR